jgi:hypothetical protein
MSERLMRTGRAMVVSTVVSRVTGYFCSSAAPDGWSP